MNFFGHKDLGNHLLQLYPKVVKHPVFPFVITVFQADISRQVSLPVFCVPSLFSLRRRFLPNTPQRPIFYQSELYALSARWRRSLSHSILDCSFISYCLCPNISFSDMRYALLIHTIPSNYKTTFQGHMSKGKDHVITCPRRDRGGSRGITPFILNFGYLQGWVVILKLRLFYLPPRVRGSVTVESREILFN